MHLSYRESGIIPDMPANLHYTPPKMYKISKTITDFFQQRKYFY